MFETLNLYCERTSPDFWAEPVNALTNLLFFVSAWCIWRHSKSLGAVSSGVWLLLALVCAIGIGSFLFHTFATAWAKLMDDLPILLFQLVFLWLYCREVARIRAVPLFVMILGYLLVALSARQFPQFLNGSLIYAPALIVLLALGLYHLLRQHQEPFILVAAMGVFIIALTFRTIDNAICDYFPLGSHFLWHSCNALLLYLLMRGLLVNRSEHSLS
jgi:surface polysaccharide O-acyltransferase-like enzyme